MALSRFQRPDTLNNRRGVVNDGQIGHPLTISYKSDFSNDVTDNSINTLKDLGINIERPEHTQYAVLSVRIGTFTTEWRCTQSPTNMAEAGFFYAGQGDIVFCFFCGQGLQNWDPKDIPFEEHARWSPKCVFLQNVKGKDYIECVQLKYNCPDKHSDSSSHLHAQTNGQRKGIERRKKLFDTPAIQSLLENGYGEKIINTAVTVWRKENDNEEFSSTDILEIIFKLEDGSIKPEDIQNNSDQTQSIQETLRVENTVLKQAILCRICKKDEVNVAFLPCGHLCTCQICALAMKTCPICKTFIKGNVKTFLV